MTDFRRAFRDLVAAGHGRKDASGCIVLAVASRRFKCPGCTGSLQLALDEEGRAAALHSLPPCEHYNHNDGLAEILGPDNYALLGEEWWT